MILTFSVLNQTLKRTDTNKVVEKSNKYLNCKFNFETNDWDGLTIAALFKTPDMDKPIAVYLENGMCEMPITVSSCNIALVGATADNIEDILDGENPDGVVITTNAVCVIFSDTIDTDGIADLRDDNNDFYKFLLQMQTYADNARASAAEAEEKAQSILDKVGNLSDLYTSDKTSVIAAINDNFSALKLKLDFIIGYEDKIDTYYSLKGTVYYISAPSENSFDFNFQPYYIYSKANGLSGYFNILQVKTTGYDIQLRKGSKVPPMNSAIQWYAWHSIATSSEISNLTSQIESKADKSDMEMHSSNTSNPHNVTKSQLGLGNIDNTSDLSKPISTAQQTALEDITNNITVIADNFGGFKAGNIATTEQENGSGSPVAIGDHAMAKYHGVALGTSSKSTGVGLAAGWYSSCTGSGVAIGYAAKTRHGIALGDSAQAVDLSGTPIDAIQFGNGTNNTANTMQVYNKRIVESDGSLADVGNLEELSTTDKTTVVSAINEIADKGQWEQLFDTVTLTEEASMIDIADFENDDVFIGVTELKVDVYIPKNTTVTANYLLSIAFLSDENQTAYGNGEKLWVPQSTAFGSIYYQYNIYYSFLFNLDVGVPTAVRYSDAYGAIAYVYNVYGTTLKSLNYDKNTSTYKGLHIVTGKFDTPVITLPIGTKISIYGKKDGAV